jgi:ornithine cyclodeaminase/alanine dehydrogenase-like protein (mu-crystallin family)
MPSSAIPFLDAEAIAGAVPIADLLDAVETAFRDVAAGRDRSPLRTHVAIDAGDLLLMTGVRAGGAGASVKLVTIVPGNADRGLPTIHALVAWLDAATGRPVALLDGPMITAMRTGAASGVATRLLARADASTLAVIGAGAQAEWQVLAVLAARRISRIVVYARSAEATAGFAARMQELTGVTTGAAGSAREAVESADVVCCATTATEPVFDAEWVRPGTHVNGIGAFRLGMVELPPALFGRARLVAVDSREAARAEAGDVMAAVSLNSVAERDLVEIGTVGRDWVDGRPPDAITVFKSVGLAIQDVAAAELAVSRLLGSGEAEAL